MARFAPCVAGVLVLAAALAPAAARGADSVEFSGAVGVTREDNIFRLAEGVDEPDTYRRAAAGLLLDLPVRAQHFTAEGRFEDYRYQRFTDLDHDAYSAKLGWQWRLGNRLDGQLDWEVGSTLTSFANLQAGAQITVPNKLVTHRARAEAGYGLGRRVQLRAAVDRLEQSNDAPAYLTSDMQRNGGEVSLALAGKLEGDRIGVTARVEDATLPNRQLVVRRLVDNSYRQRRVGPFLEWAPGGRTSLRVRGSRLERNYDDLPRRDFAAWTWSADATWQPTGRLMFTAQLLHDVSEFEEVNLDMVLVDGLGLQTAWTFSERMNLMLDLQHNQRVHHGDAAAVGDLLEERLDSQQLNFSWQVTRMFGFSLSARQERRRSARAGNFTARIGSAEVRLAF